MRISFQQAVAVAAVFFISASAHAAESDPAQRDLVQASLLADVDAVTPGQSFTLGVRLKMKEHWHTYWINPGETGNATQITPHGPAGIEFGAVGWPLPTKINAIGGVVYGYDNEVLFLVPVKVAKDFNAKDATIEANVEWVGCQKEECVEGSAKLAIKLPVSLKAKPVNAELFQAWKQRLPHDGNDPAAKVPSVVEWIDADGMSAGLSVLWKQGLPRNVDFFPISTNAAAIGDVEVKSAGEQTQIRFKTKIYKAEDVPQGKLGGLLVYEDESGRRHGIPVNVRVIKTK